MVEFEKTFQISKMDEARHTVTGTAASETPDSDGEIFDYPFGKESFQRLASDSASVTSASGTEISLGPVRPMHQLQLAGKIVHIAYDDANKTITLTSEPLPEYWDLIQRGFLLYYSIGGRKAWEKPEGPYTRYGAIIQEVSYVDRGANPDCSISVIRSTGQVELMKFQKRGALYSMTKSDHAECEKRYGKMAENAEGQAKLFRDAAAHHRKMAAASPDAFADVDTSAKAAHAAMIQKAIADSQPLDRSGGLFGKV